MDENGRAKVATEVMRINFRNDYKSERLCVAILVLS